VLTAKAYTVKDLQFLGFLHVSSGRAEATVGQGGKIEHHFWVTNTSNGLRYATGPLSCPVCL